MARILERYLTRQDKDEGLKISSGAHLLPTVNTNLRVMNGNSEEVLVFEYQVSVRETPVIRGKKWKKFIGRYSTGVTVTLYTYQGSDADCQILVR
ncbi:Uncharacterized protein TCM_006268 [Theobroma cacao]|uniref:Uncharacterized protein n=1 Tax=Theobroma cacao TaxID=3641 RepID=A0A061DYR0_THECC|nr:Uncharacterized protein TCM_006268 [Theobroma cacao]